MRNHTHVKFATKNLLPRRVYKQNIFIHTDEKPHMCDVSEEIQRLWTNDKAYESAHWRKYINLWCFARKYFLSHSVLRCTATFMQMKSHTSVICLRRYADQLEKWSNIWESTLVKNHIHVIVAIKDLLSPQTWQDITTSIQVKRHMSVTVAKRILPYVEA